MLPANLPQPQSIEVNGLHFRYVDWGNPSAPPLLLLHGLGSNLHAWDHVAPYLAGAYRVVAMDQRGHGDSPWTADYLWKGFIQDLEGFVVALGLAPFTLVGHSMGGLNAIAYAAAHPEEITRLVIVDIGPGMSRASVDAIRTRATSAPESFADLDEVFDHVRAQDPTPADDLVRHRAGHGVKQLPSGRWVFKADPALADGERGYRKAGQKDMWAMLAAIPCPTLVIRGARSDTLDPDMAREMAVKLPDGRLVEVEGAGHRVPLDNPAGFERAMRDFLGV